MPKISDIVSIAESLEKAPVVAIEDRCTAVRNRNSTCTKCTDACIGDAITVGDNHVTVAALECVNCGDCITVCPNEVFVGLNPTVKDITERLAQSFQTNEGVPVFACARRASKREADVERYAEVPCLGRIDESKLISCIAAGASEVVLVDGDCSTCKYRKMNATLDATIESAEALLAAVGAEGRIKRVSAFPDFLLEEDEGGSYGSTRRGFFSEAANSAKDVAITAAKKALEQQLGFIQDQRDIGERLRVDDEGNLPQLVMHRHDTIINGLDVIGEPKLPKVKSRVFGSVTIDGKMCNGCGMCAVFCPTHALRRVYSKNDPSKLRVLEFSASDCVMCGVCVDVCWKKCLHLSDTVDTAELFDFEPRSMRVG